ncbi:hypothetical protein [Phocicoccus pinnipedialis]|uniref:Teichoic acids export ATP-binding protein TagH n=1 Tax=Phocicoccus pinnipedialis TaxID=110845 RepID=A0A6V7RPG9_9BACL|nr:hypothetical protein [Jeotgalicoccus pinnipedialis]MBP1940249.1 teichoic acid transport system ATP-binding protein [Jeotgalicoccus pinnipedialis]CAD2079497.1 Teichoic acids export ATP-binding protein TagH [Jeotgalicoccus pinnipedialis]
MQEIVLHRATDIVYHKEPDKLKDRILNTPTHIVLKNISTTLYRGEVLGILGDYETLKFLKDILVGLIQPDSGRIRYKDTFLSLDVEDHILNDHLVHIFITEILEEYMTETELKKSLLKLNRHPLINNHWEKPITNLSRQDIAVILLEVSAEVNADITVYNNFFRYLNESSFLRFKEVVNTHETKNRGVYLLESSFEPIELLANHFIWLSYGQMRFEGTVKKGFDVYNQYLKKRSQLKSLDEEALFDLEWKERMYETAQFKHNFQRRQKKYESVIDKINIQRVIISFILVFTIILSSTLIFMDIQFSKEQKIFTEEKLTDTSEEVSNRLRYGFIISDDFSVDGIEIAKYSLIRITSDQGDTMTASVNGKEVKVTSKDVLYFNPASMYESVQADTVRQYTTDTYLYNYMFYSHYLNKDVSVAKDNMTLTDESKYSVKVDGIDITYLVDNETIIGLVTSGSDQKEIIEAFDIQEDEGFKIFKSENGFVVYDKEANNWLFLSR